VECEDKKKSSSWFDRAYIARLSPIVIEFTLEEMSGHTVSIQTQYSNPPLVLSPPPQDVLYYLCVDDLLSWNRYSASVKPGDNEEKMFELALKGSIGRSMPVTFQSLLTWGYHAVKASTSEYLLKDIADSIISIFALVDLESAVTYGFKFVLQSNESLNEGIWLVPEKMFVEARAKVFGIEAPASPTPTLLEPSKPDPALRKETLSTSGSWSLGRLPNLPQEPGSRASFSSRVQLLLVSQFYKKLCGVANWSRQPD